jgi:hypothetical protein
MLTQPGAAATASNLPSSVILLIGAMPRGSPNHTFLVSVVVHAGRCGGVAVAMGVCGDEGRRQHLDHSQPLPHTPPILTIFPVPQPRVAPRGV